MDHRESSVGEKFGYGRSGEISPCLLKGRITDGEDGGGFGRGRMFFRGGEQLGLEHVFFSVAIGFIQKAKAFQQESLGGLRYGLFRAAALEINFKSSAGPGKNFVDRFIALQLVILGVVDLTISKIHAARV